MARILPRILITKSSLEDGESRAIVVSWLRTKPQLPDIQVQVLTLTCFATGTQESLCASVSLCKKKITILWKITTQFNESDELLLLSEGSLKTRQVKNTSKTQRSEVQIAVRIPGNKAQGSEFSP